MKQLTHSHTNNGKTAVAKPLEHLRQVDDKQAEAYVLSSLAGSYRLSGKLADAQTCLKDSLALCELIGDEEGVSEVLDALAELPSFA